MKSILFDEKIAGSFHLTPGNCYDTTPNGNKSAVHWDLVQIQRPEYGGGEIWIDDVLIRENGIFLPKNLRGLNPENLTSANYIPEPMRQRAKAFSVLGIAAVITGLASQSNIGLGIGAAICLGLVGYSKFEISRYRRQHPSP
jgi:hypothetical protein